jgi:Protein of unknown function (DUF1064)
MSRFTEDEYLQVLRQNPRLRPVAAPASHDARLEVPSPKPAKYRNRKTADGFDSEKERRLWQELELRAKAGEITELQRQVKFALVVNGIHVCDYKADFTWKDGARRVVADAKSVMTRTLAAYRIKFKLMQACHGITIEEL